MNQDQFLAILHELVDENPFAIRAVLNILEVAFTDKIPTLAVTCEAKPRLLVNLGFVSQHCLTEDHVKAVICHEFLHVLLRHTATHIRLTRARHIAFDAVINAIITREHGEPYASFFSSYYGNEKGITRILRPMTDKEFTAYFDSPSKAPAWATAWVGLYSGHLVADDIEELAKDVVSHPPVRGIFKLSNLIDDGDDKLLGNHADLGSELSPELTDALNRSLKELNGSGIWRSPPERGVGADSYQALIDAANIPLQKWRATTLAVLKQHLTPSRQAGTREEQARDYQIPVPSPSDRRAFIRTLWDPILPQALWPGTVLKPRATTQVYLDVSGSMNAEMPALIALLGRLSSYIRRPFWAFSDVVAPATIEGGALKAATTGGTSMACVLDHIARTQPTAAVVVTDGYIEALSHANVQGKLGTTRLHAIVSRDGDGARLRAAGIPYTQLERIPT